MGSEIQAVNLNIENKKQEVLFSGHVTQLTLFTYWDSHGKMIPFPGHNNKNSERIHNCDVVITKSTYDIVYPTLSTVSYEDWILTINGKTISGDVQSFGGTYSSMRIKLCVGND